MLCDSTFCTDGASCCYKYLDRSFFTLPSMGEGEGEAGHDPHARPLMPPISTSSHQEEGEESLYKNLCPST